MSLLPAFLLFAVHGSSDGPRHRSAQGVRWLGMRSERWKRRCRGGHTQARNEVVLLAMPNFFRAEVVLERGAKSNVLTFSAAGRATRDIITLDSFLGLLSIRLVRKEFP